jgi:hypothetical protein
VKMTELTLHLDDAVAERLRSRAQREGIAIDELVEREVARIASGDPFGFFSTGSSDDLRGADFRRQLEQEGFGTR